MTISNKSVPVIRVDNKTLIYLQKSPALMRGYFKTQRTNYSTSIALRSANAFSRRVTIDA